MASRAEFYRPGKPHQVVGVAIWSADGVRVESVDEEVREALGRTFRPVPVVVDDPSLRTAGTSGPAVLTPGSLSWFHAAARGRSQEEGLAARIVPDDRTPIGWDPAGAYRTFSSVVARARSR
jgi:hypothetical protein